MPHQRSRLKITILAFVAIALPFLVNEFLGESVIREAPYLRWLNRDFWYERFAPEGPRQTRIDEFTIVFIVPNVEPGSALGENRCTHRAFMAKLLTKLAEADPRLIVIDKWYNKLPAGTCTPENNGTPALKNAIRTVSAKVPMVIAVGSYNRKEVRRYCPHLGPEDLKSDEVVLGNSEPLDQDVPANRLALGLAWTNADVRKIPLAWMAFRDCDQVGHSPAGMWPSISAAAAALINPNIMQRHNLTKMQLQIKHPYTKLVHEGGFQSVSAIRLVCNHADPNVEWKQCDPSEGDAQALAGLRHHIVIVGEASSDMHKTVSGTMTGPEMQASYIASLLDESLLQPAPRWVNYLVSAAWFIVMFWIFYRWKPELPELALVVSGLMTFTLGLFFNAIITRQWGIFADVVPPTILEIIGLYIARRVELGIEHEPRSKQAH